MAKISKAKNTVVPRANVFLGRGVADPSQGQNSTPSVLGGTKTKMKEAHTSPQKTGMGNYYGTGFKSKIGKVRDSTVGYRPVSREQMGTSPKSLA